MKRTFRLLQFFSCFLLLFTGFIDGKMIDMKKRASSSQEQTEVTGKDNEPVSDATSLKLRLPRHHSNVDGLFKNKVRSLFTEGISKNRPLVHPHSGELIRLRSQDKSLHSGFVEVYQDGKWGYVCDDGWDITDANVACKELGFTLGATSATTDTHERLRQSQKDSAAVLMDDVQCFGTESSLQQCPYSVLNDCSLEDAASVKCQSDQRCPKHWISGFDKCYKFYTQVKTTKQASDICLRDNASLVTIDSIQENHFLSSIMKTSVSSIHQWYTGGTKLKNIWQWEQVVAESVVNKLYTLTTNYITKPVFANARTAVTVNKWFPGWPSHNNEQEEPKVKKRYNCLTLSDTYKDPVNESLVVVDYFYWKAAKCMASKGINFICQITTGEKKDITEEDCYTEDGSSYRGTVAVTEAGVMCLKWSSSPNINDKTHPGKGLGDHNFCRNPDSDAKPWCWTENNQGTFGACKLLQCAHVNTPKETIMKLPANLHIQLVGGRDMSEGNVEIVVDGLQYRVCDDNWDNQEASVICRMLGFRFGGIATKNSLFGADLLDIILDDVDCNGTETDLSECTVIMGVKQHDCGPEEYAGAICAKNPEISALPVPKKGEHKFAGKCGQRPFDGQIILKPQIVKNKKFTHGAPQNLQKFQESRIVGGKFVQHGAIPWQVRIHLTFNLPSNGNFYGLHYCGAAIISEFWVLSASHCFVGKRKDEFTVFVGDHNQKMKDFGEQSFSIDEIILHENYNDDTKDYDIALVKIKPTENGKGIQYNQYVQPACLPDSTTTYTEGLKCLVAGWGYVKPRMPDEEGGPDSCYPIILKSAEIPLLGLHVCEQLYTKYVKSYVSERMFCAGYVKGGTDSCDGDSGGPLVCNITGVYTVIGITSWGRGCAVSNLPGVYARVKSFVPWIEEKIKSHSKTSAERNLPKKL